MRYRSYVSQPLTEEQVQLAERIVKALPEEPDGDLGHGAR
jgi:hypothetical protein